jgi:flagellar hook-associated protein FlgK
LQTEKRASEDEKAKIRNDRNELLDLADQRQTMVEELEERMEVSLEEQKRNTEAVQGENRQLLEEQNLLHPFENEMKEKIGSL